MDTICCLVYALVWPRPAAGIPICQNRPVPFCSAVTHQSGLEAASAWTCGLQPHPVSGHVCKRDEQAVCKGKDDVSAKAGMVRLFCFNLVF